MMNIVRGRKVEYLDDATTFQCLRCIERCDAAAECRALNDRGVTHAGQAHIDSEHGSAINLRSGIEARLRLSQQGETRGIFDGDVFRNRQLARRLGELTERRAPIRRFVLDHAPGNTQLIDSHSKACRRR